MTEGSDIMPGNKHAYGIGFARDIRHEITHQNTYKTNTKFQFNSNTKVLAVLKHLSYLKDLIDLKQSIFIILLFIIDAIGKQEHYQITMHYEHEVL